MTWFTNQISTLIMKDMRLELFHHVMEQSLSYLSRQPVGRLVTRLTSDIEVISQFFSDVLSAFIKDASIMIGSLIVLFLLSWKLALIVLTTMPFVFIAAAIARIKARDAFRNQRYWTSKVNSYLSEHISGIDIVKLFVQEDKVSENFSKNSKQLLKANIAEMYVYATFRPFVDFMATFWRNSIPENANIDWYPYCFYQPNFHVLFSHQGFIGKIYTFAKCNGEW